jgi:hypothetical protein
VLGGQVKATKAGIVIVVVLLSSCITYRLVPQETSGNRIKYDRGNQVLFAHDDKMAVATSAQVYKGRIYFNVLAKNLTEREMHLEDSGATLVEIGIDGKSLPIKVYRAEEYYEKRKIEIVTGQVLMVLSAALSTINAGRSTSYTNGNYSVYGQNRNHYYSGFGSYNSVTTTYDPAAAAMEREIAFANVRDYANGTRQELDYLKDTLFFPSDVGANGEYFGIIVSDFGGSDASYMIFELGFESSRFRFEFNKDFDQ